jgi:sodium-dependent dicarboxylate transporter 2/3/5
MDFLKYGFFLWVISMLVVWVIEFMVIYNAVGFPEGITETATSVMEKATR